MSDDVRQQHIGDLGLSVRSSDLLRGLGVETLGELLALPEIVIPEDWPPKIARLVAQELRETIDALGVRYEGEIIAPARAAARRKATGDVASRWQAIAEWLGAEHPDALEHWNPPATADAIDAAEEKLGRTLPDDYRQFLRIHDGQKDLAPMVRAASLLPIAKVVEAKARLRADPDAPVGLGLNGPGVRDVDYSPGWIPIGRSARGRDYLCIDLDPAPGGAVGQMIAYAVDDPARPLVAKSFADLLSLYFEEAQAGDLDLDEH